MLTLPPLDDGERVVARGAPPALADLTQPSLFGRSSSGYVDENRIAIKIRRGALLAGNVPADASDDSNGSTIEFTAAVDFKRRGVASKIVVPGLPQQNQASNCDPALINAIARGFRDEGPVQVVRLGHQGTPSVGPVQGDGMTQFGRSLHALNIDILCANTPQAKGRVERANKTLQDRLVKELRLQGISTIAAGNQLLPGFLA